RSRLVSSAWPSALLILWAPVWARSSRLRWTCSLCGSRAGPSAAIARSSASWGKGAGGKGGGGRGGGAREPLEQLPKIRPEPRVVAEPGVLILELAERGHECLGDVATAERAVLSPAAGRGGVEEPRMDGRRADREVGSVEACGAGALGKERDL